MQAFEQLAPFFTYPDETYAARAAACAQELDSEDLRVFAALIAAVPLAMRQEFFVQTFDFNPATTLEIGWHLFGEQYERGQFLVDLRERLRAAGIEEQRELPDHLIHVLPLAARMPPADRADFAARTLAPALDKIAAALPDGGPFQRLVQAARHYVAVAAETDDGAKPLGKGERHD